MEKGHLRDFVTQQYGLALLGQLTPFLESSQDEVIEPRLPVVLERPDGVVRPADRLSQILVLVAVQRGEQMRGSQGAATVEQALVVAL